MHYTYMCMSKKIERSFCTSFHEFSHVFTRTLFQVGARLQNPFFQVLQVVGNKGKIVMSQLKIKTYFYKMENNILTCVTIQRNFLLFFWLINLLIFDALSPKCSKKNIQKYIFNSFSFHLVIFFLADCVLKLCYYIDIRLLILIDGPGLSLTSFTSRRSHIKCNKVQ